MKRLLPFFIACVMIFSACNKNLPGEVSGDVADGDTTNTINDDTQAPNEIGVCVSLSGGLNPYTNHDEHSVDYFNLIYDKLFEIDPNFKLVPVIAESYTYKNNSFRIKLKKNLTFSDGKKLTANSVVSSLKLAKAEGSYYSTRLSCVTGWRVVSAYELSVSVNQDNVNLIRNFDFPILKVQISRVTGREDPSLPPIGSGLFVPADDKLIANNENPRSKSLKYKQINIISVANPDEAAYQIEAGKASFYSFDGTSTTKNMVKKSELTIPYNTTDFIYLGFNTKSGVFEDPSLRLAVSKSFDRKKIIDEAFLGDALSATLPISPMFADVYDMYGKALVFDKAVSRNLISEVLKEDKTLSLLVNEENAARVTVANRIAESLMDTPLKVQVVSLPYGEYLTRLKKGEFDLFICQAELTGDFAFGELFKSGGSLNFGKYYKSDFNNKVNLFMLASLEEVNEDSKMFYKAFTEQVPICPIAFKKHLLYVQKGAFTSITPSAKNVFFGFENWK